MFVTDTILRIRALCPIFENRVFGSAQLEEGLRQAETIPVPVAFVMYEGTFPTENVDVFAAAQEAMERWAVIVAVANQDQRGQWATNLLHTVRRQLIRALYGWEDVEDPGPTNVEGQEEDRGPVLYRGDIHMSMNAARLWHQFMFEHKIVLHAVKEYEQIPIPPPVFRGVPTPHPRIGEPYYDPTEGETNPLTHPDEPTNPGENPYPEKRVNPARDPFEEI